MRYDEQTQQQMKAMISAWQQSGLSQKVYCQQNAVRYHVFHYWYKRFREALPTKAAEGFIPLQFTPAPPVDTGAVHSELLLPGGTRIVFYQPVAVEYLKALLG